MGLLGFFKGIGRLAKAIVGLVHKIPQEWQDKAILLVEQAAIKYTDNAQRREWAVGELQKVPGISESSARWLVESGVQLLKQKATA